MAGLEELAKRIVDVLNEEKLEYVIVGGFAVSSWGNARTTVDIDVIVDQKGLDIESFKKRLLEKGFLAEKEDIEAAFREKSHFTLFDRDSSYHIDIKGVYGAFDLLSIRRRKKILIDKNEFYIASAEDTIASKLLFGSEQDIRDAEGIFVRQMNNLDEKYLTKICRDVGIGEELAKMKKRIEKRFKDT